MPTQLVSGLGGAVGSRYLPINNQLLFVEYSAGKVSVLNLIRPYVATVSSGTTVLKGTWIFDCETGLQGGSAPPGDIWWEQQTATVRDIKPLGGAKVFNLGHVDYNTVTAATMQGLPYGTTPINGNADATNQLTDGDVFAVLTNSGNYCKVQVLTYGYDMTIRWATYQVGPRYRVLGTGYTNPEDIAATRDEMSAYVTERSGTLVRVSLAAANRAGATVVASGLTAPHQMFLDEANNAIYTVEFASPGRLLRIGLPAGPVTPVVSGLENAVGLLLTSDRQTAYVTEQAAAGNRLVKIDLATGTRTVIATGLTQPFFLTWADVTEERILLTERGAARRVAAIDLTRSPALVTAVATGLPTNPSSCAVIGLNKLLVCCDGEIDELEVPGITISSTAPLFMGIGKVPIDRIGLPAASAAGLANTSGDPTYPFQVANVPFGGTLPILVNHLRAYADGARYYRVMVDGTPRFDGLTDYRWSSGLNRFQARTISAVTLATGSGFFPVRDPAEMSLWLSPALGMQLNTVGLSNTLHSIRIDFVTSTGAAVASSATVSVLVNNQACTAFIDQPRLGASAVADTECGLLKYTVDASGAAQGSVNVGFTAAHPAGFGSYSFQIIKGAGTPRLSLAGQAVVPGTHSATETTANLLGVCKIAGFAASLYVAATMINGEGRQSQYDASALIAFVLAPS